MARLTVCVYVTFPRPHPREGEAHPGDCGTPSTSPPHPQLTSTSTTTLAVGANNITLFPPPPLCYNGLHYCQATDHHNPQLSNHLCGGASIYPRMRAPSHKCHEVTWGPSLRQLAAKGAPKQWWHTSPLVPL